MALLRVVIADDHYLVREGVRQALERSERITVIAVVGDASELESVVDAEHPDIVVTDIRMPPLNRTDGIDSARRIRASHPETGILVLSQYNDPSYARQLLEDGVTGVGYLLKERVGDPMRLIAAVEEVAGGGSVVDPEVVASLVARTERNPDSPTAQLTGRERDVLAAPWPRAARTRRSQTACTSRCRRSRSTAARSSPSWDCWTNPTSIGAWLRSSPTSTTADALNPSDPSARSRTHERSLCAVRRRCLVRSRGAWRRGRGSCG